MGQSHFELRQNEDLIAEKRCINIKLQEVTTVGSGQLEVNTYSTDGLLLIVEELCCAP